MRDTQGYVSEVVVISLVDLIPPVGVGIGTFHVTLKTRLSPMVEAYDADLTLGKTWGQRWCFQIPEITSCIIIGSFIPEFLSDTKPCFLHVQKQNNPISVPTSGLGDFFLSFFLEASLPASQKGRPLWVTRSSPLALASPPPTAFPEGESLALLGASFRVSQPLHSSHEIFIWLFPR